MVEVEHNSEYYCGFVYSLPKPRAKADNTNRGRYNARYHEKTEFDNSFIVKFVKLLSANDFIAAGTKPIVCRHDVTSTNVKAIVCIGMT